MAGDKKPTIVLIHGIWMTPHSWQPWIERFSKAGYKAIAPGWPGVEDRSIAEIRQNPAPLTGVVIHDVVNHYEKIIRELDEPPIIMGHSFGGLFTQLLLSRGLGCAGVAISAVAPAGVNKLDISVLTSLFPLLKNPFDDKVDGLVPLTMEQYHFTFVNELNEAEAKESYDKDYIPGSANVLWQGILSGYMTKGDSEVDWYKKDRAPLLLFGGDDDHIIPGALSESVYDKYSGPTPVDVKLFSGRTHHISNQTGWEEVADYSLEWAEKHLK